jgi:hypothetical protein
MKGMGIEYAPVGRYTNDRFGTHKDFRACETIA